MTVYYMVEAQKFTAAHAINLAFAHDVPGAKCVPLLAILARADFEDLLTSAIKWPIYQECD
jgi:hypothetical protein